MVLSTAYTWCGVVAHAHSTALGSVGRRIRRSMVSSSIASLGLAWITRDPVTAKSKIHGKNFFRVSRSRNATSYDLD